MTHIQVFRLTHKLIDKGIGLRDVFKKSNPRYLNQRLLRIDCFLPFFLSHSLTHFSWFRVCDPSSSSSLLVSRLVVQASGRREDRGYSLQKQPFNSAYAKENHWQGEEKGREEGEELVDWGEGSAGCLITLCPGIRRRERREKRKKKDVTRKS